MCRDPLQGLENFLKRAWECPALLVPTWPWSLTSPLSRLHIRLSSAPVNQISTRSRFITTGGLLLLLPGESSRHHPAMLRRCRRKHQCIFADGQKASTVVHRNYSLQPGQSTGILGRQLVQRTKMLVWGLLVTLSSLSHPPVLFFPSSNPLTFPPFFHISFSQNVKLQKGLSQVILHFPIVIQIILHNYIHHYKSKHYSF